ncbi:MAG: acyl-CoA dehydrogenase family protein, partial [Chloroflexota bacterium]
YALKCMIGECARKYDSGEPAAVDAAMCKLFGIEATRRVSDQALFIHGGMGYEKSLPIERIYRDARSLWFEEGTPTVQKLVIGRDVLGKRIRQSGK